MSHEDNRRVGEKQRNPLIDERGLLKGWEEIDVETGESLGASEPATPEDFAKAREIGKSKTNKKA